MSKLNKTQAALLVAAANRRDHLLAPPQDATDRAIKTLGTTLVNLGLVRRMPVKVRQPAWMTEESGVRMGLALAEAGLQAAQAASPAEREGGSSDITPEVDRDAQDQGCDHADQTATGAGAEPTESPTAPRDGTKEALVLGLLRRECGASLDELVAATGWLPHTTRAALTGLRQRGFGVYRHKAPDGRSVYLIPNPGEALASEATLRGGPTSRSGPTCLTRPNGSPSNSSMAP